MTRATYLVIGGLALAATVTAVAAARAANTAERLELTPEARLGKPSLTGLEFTIDAAFRNPTRGSLKLHDPIVTLRLPATGQELMRLDMKGRTLTIAPQSSGKLSDPGQLGGRMKVDVPYQALSELAPQAIRAVLGLGPPFTIEVATQVLVEAPGLPRLRHTDRQRFTLSSPVS